MGISIRFRAVLGSAADAAGLLRAATEYATQSGWHAERRGAELILDPGRESEPLHITIGADGAFGDDVKTQFAGPGVHREIVGFLDRIKPLLASLEVTDDSEFWEERNEKELKEAFKRTATLIDDARTRVAPMSTGQFAVYWLKIIGLCIGFFFAVVAVVLIVLWVTGRLGT
jgi:hypothetical protein